MHERVAALLATARVHKIGHSGRTLFEHLSGTAALLKSAGYPEYVVLGGMFHSIYGTNAFKRRAMSFHERNKVERAIGRQAERLAFLFGIIDRPAAIHGSLAVFARDDVATTPVQMAAPYGEESIVLDRHTVGDLAAIEAANLLEQGAFNERAQRRYPEFGRFVDRIAGAVRPDAT